jgi:hypothetical protein
VILLRWFSRLTLVVALIVGLFFVVAFVGPPEWLYRAQISFTEGIGAIIARETDSFDRLNAGAPLETVFPDHAAAIAEHELRYTGGVLVVPSGLGHDHYYDIQGACWLFDTPRLTTLTQCPR